MSGTFVLSPRARSDLAGIWDFSVIRWGQDQAEKYVRDVQRDILFVAADPRCGRSAENVRAGYFKYPTGSHVLFYRLTSQGIDVVRILHSAMDFDQHL